jgi:hypothetical protein
MNALWQSRVNLEFENRNLLSESLKLTYYLAPAQDMEKPLPLTFRAQGRKLVQAFLDDLAGLDHDLYNIEGLPSAADLKANFESPKCGGFSAGPTLFPYWTQPRDLALRETYYQRLVALFVAHEIHADFLPLVDWVLRPLEHQWKQRLAVIRKDGYTYGLVNIDYWDLIEDLWPEIYARRASLLGPWFTGQCPVRDPETFRLLNGGLPPQIAFLAQYLTRHGEIISVEQKSELYGYLEMLREQQMLRRAGSEGSLRKFVRTSSFIEKVTGSARGELAWTGSLSW